MVLEYQIGYVTEDFKANPVILQNFLNRPNNLNGYVPRNKKLLTYPYCYATFNPSGNIYRFEDFINGSLKFKVMSEINPNPQVKFIPLNYEGVDDTAVNYLNMGTLSGFPCVGWSVDTYNVWLAQNRDLLSLQIDKGRSDTLYSDVRNAIDTASTITSSVSGLVGNGVQALKGDFVGAGMGVFNNLTQSGFKMGNNLVDFMQNHTNFNYLIKNQLAVMKQHQMLPDEVNQGSTDTTLLGYDLMDINLFSVMTIKAQFAEIIDQYFDLYGYQTNKLKVPNLWNRPSWNYVKTIDANIIGNIPQQDLQALRNMFDNGVTLWHNPYTFLDYSQNNR